MEQEISASSIYLIKEDPSPLLLNISTMLISLLQGVNETGTAASFYFFYSLVSRLVYSTKSDSGVRVRLKTSTQLVLTVRSAGGPEDRTVGESLQREF